MGETIVKGAIASSTQDLAKRPYIGLAFRSELSDGSYRYISIPKIKFSPEEFEAVTRKEKTEMKTAKLTGQAVPLASTGVYKVTCDSNATDVDAEWLAKFLETIPQSTPTATEAKTK